MAVTTVDREDEEEGGGVMAGRDSFPSLASVRRGDDARRQLTVTVAIGSKWWSALLHAARHAADRHPPLVSFEEEGYTRLTGRVVKAHHRWDRGETEFTIVEESNVEALLRNELDELVRESRWSQRYEAADMDEEG